VPGAHAQGVGRGHLTRGQVGDRERGKELLREAEREVEAMDVPFYAAQVRGRLQGLGTGCTGA
jgi:hypothetical protein